MKMFATLAAVLFMSSASAETTMKMNYTNEDVTKVIEAYSKASGQKFVVDAGVRGKTTIILPAQVTIAEAFNHLSSALAINGYAISTQGDTMVVRSARNVQRDLIETTTAVPALKPERMVTWIYSPKHTTAMSINRDLRIMTSKDGELSVHEGTNQLILSDWASNINRISQVLKEIDKPIDATTAKLIEAGKKERAAYRAEFGDRRGPPTEFKKEEAPKAKE